MFCFPSTILPLRVGREVLISICHFVSLSVVIASVILTSVGRQNYSRTPLANKFCMNSSGVTNFK